MKWQNALEKGFGYLVWNPYYLFRGSILYFTFYVLHIEITVLFGQQQKLTPSSKNT